MRVLVDILHPAHVHFFKNFREEMIARGHEVIVTARDKDVALALLDANSIPYETLSSQARGTLGLATELTRRTARLVGVVRRTHPDVLTGIMGPSIALAGKLLRKPAVVFYDTEFAARTNRFVYPLAAYVCTPDSYQAPVNGKHVTYPGYHELAYLHPSRFKPDPAKLTAFGLVADEPYSVVRFVSWEASHDVGEVALSPQQKRGLVEELHLHGKVLLSSESRLPDDLEAFAASGPAEDIHHVLAFARVVVGESATMSSEAAVLGTPAVFIAKTGRGYTDEQEERYGLVRFFQPDAIDGALRAAAELAQQPADWRAARHSQLLHDKIDVTDWMVEFFGSKFDFGISRGQR